MAGRRRRARDGEDDAAPSSVLDDPFADLFVPTATTKRVATAEQTEPTPTVDWLPPAADPDSFAPASGARNVPNAIDLHSVDLQASDAGPASRAKRVTTPENPLPVPSADTPKARRVTTPEKPAPLPSIDTQVDNCEIPSPGVSPSALSDGIAAALITRSESPLAALAGDAEVLLPQAPKPLGGRGRRLRAGSGGSPDPDDNNSSANAYDPFARNRPNKTQETFTSPNCAAVSSTAEVNPTATNAQPDGDGNPTGRAISAQGELKTNEEVTNTPTHTTDLIASRVEPEEAASSPIVNPTSEHTLIEKQQTSPDATFAPTEITGFFPDAEEAEEEIEFHEELEDDVDPADADNSKAQQEPATLEPVESPTSPKTLDPLLILAENEVPTKLEQPLSESGVEIDALEALASDAVESVSRGGPGDDGGPAEIPECSQTKGQELSQDAAATNLQAHWRGRQARQVYQAAAQRAEATSQDTPSVKPEVAPCVVIDNSTVDDAPIAMLRDNQSAIESTSSIETKVQVSDERPPVSYHAITQEQSARVEPCEDTSLVSHHEIEPERKLWQNDAPTHVDTVDISRMPENMPNSYDLVEATPPESFLGGVAIDAFDLAAGDYDEFPMPSGHQNESPTPDLPYPSHGNTYAPVAPGGPSPVPWYRRRVRPAPDPAKVLSEEAVRRRAEKQLGQSMKAVAHRLPSIVPAYVKSTQVPPVDLSRLPPQVQENLLRVARYEAEEWLQEETHMAAWTAREERRWQVTETKLERWREDRWRAEQEEKQKQVRTQRAQEHKEQKERDRFQQRRIKLQDEVANWACEKGDREQKEANAAREAAQAETERKQKRAQAYRNRQKAKLEDYYKKQAEREAAAALDEAGGGEVSGDEGKTKKSRERSGSRRPHKVLH